MSSTGGLCEIGGGIRALDRDIAQREEGFLAFSLLLQELRDLVCFPIALFGPNLIEDVLVCAHFAEGLIHG
ncbi:MAG: hypothetical protein WDN31_04020 [Hyphomicrobium sp.]